MNPNPARNEIVVCQPDDAIQSLILTVRGAPVLLDRDLATLYGVPTKALNQAVKRNAERFPPDFMFQLTREECSRSQIVTMNAGRGSNLKYLPYAFTENGVAMLSGVLRSSTAATDIATFNAQYPTLSVQVSKAFHDRFLVLDDKELYLVGASLKDLGAKCFAFSKMDASTIPDIKSRI